MCCLHLKFLQALQNYRSCRQESLQFEIKSEVEKRLKEKIGYGAKESKPSVPVLRVRLIDLLNPSELTNSATLSIWKPEKDLCDQIEENSKFRIYGLSANFIRDNDVQFRTTKSTKFEKIEKHELDMAEHQRSFSDIGDIVSCESFCPRFFEVDLIGVIVSSNSQGTHGTKFETVYICDALFNFVALHFWDGINENGFDKSMFLPSSSVSHDKEKSQIFIFKNLQWRRSSSTNTSDSR